MTDTDLAPKSLSMFYFDKYLCDITFQHALCLQYELSNVFACTYVGWSNSLY